MTSSPSWWPRPSRGSVQGPGHGSHSGRSTTGAEDRAPVCHGQAALLAAKDEQGKWLFAGRKMTAFSDEEEVELGTADNAPWLLAETLRKSGARYEKGKNWAPYVVKDGNLLSGQNPASTAPW